MKADTKIETLTLRISASERAALEKVAEREDRSLAAVVRLAVKAYLASVFEKN